MTTTVGSSWTLEVRRLLVLALPIMLAQGGIMLMGAVDTFVVGRTSPLAMASVALGNTVCSVVAAAGMGLLMGLEPLVSQAHGAAEHDRTVRWRSQGLWLALIVSLPLTVLLVVSTAVFAPLGVEPTLEAESLRYIWARLPSIAAVCFFGASRSFLTSVERTRPVLVAVILANVVNLIADTALVLGLGLGAVGVGLATTVCFTLMALVTASAARAVTSQHEGSEPRARSRPRASDLATIVRLGWPIALQFALEVAVFALMGILVARYGSLALAAHQIAITLASLTFMAAVGLAVSCTTRVGMLIGAGRTDLARRSGLLAIAIGVLFMATGGVVFVLAGEDLARAFAPGQPEVERLGALFLRIAAVFSISDGMQALSAGALRGAGDTRWPLYANLGGHWFIGFPVAIWLGFFEELGPIGFWWGLSAGLTGVGVTLFVRFVVLSARPIERVNAGSEVTSDEVAA